MSQEREVTPFRATMCSTRRRGSMYGVVGEPSASIAKSSMTGGRSGVTFANAFPRCAGDARPATRAPVAHDGRRHEQAQRRAETSVDGRGYQATRWSNSYSGAGWACGPISRHPAGGISQSGGPRAGAAVGGVIGSPRLTRISRTVGASVMKARIGIAPPVVTQRRGSQSCARNWAYGFGRPLPRRRTSGMAGLRHSGLTTPPYTLRRIFRCGPATILAAGSRRMAGRTSAA
jgi:hypothetical protein